MLRPDYNLELIPAGNGDIRVLNLGLKPFIEVWRLQKTLQRLLIDGTVGDTLILCEHKPVITLGRSARHSNLLQTPERLAEKGIEVIHIERGGDVTYHGPGQLVVYPIIDLRKKRTDVNWYIRTLEEAIIQTLKVYGIKGERIEGKTGIWLSNRNGDDPRAKIASIGVRISRWCTLHGLAINVLDCSWGFSFINPCGFDDIRVAAMSEEASSADSGGVASVFCSKFFDLFGYGRKQGQLSTREDGRVL